MDTSEWFKVQKQYVYTFVNRWAPFLIRKFYWTSSNRGYISWTSFWPHVIFQKSQSVTENMPKSSGNSTSSRTHNDWGAGRTVLLRRYRSLVRSKLDCWCIVYVSTRQSYLKQLDLIHHLGLRIARGAFRTSPAQSLYVGGTWTTSVLPSFKTV